MEWLNYHHLLYFWVTAREGSLAAAGKVLRLARPTLSGQIHALEESLGEKLFARVGRRLELTEMGRVVFRYADEIFTLGGELLDTVKGRKQGVVARLEVGVADVVTKLVVRRLLEPALRLSPAIRLICHEDNHDRLLTRLGAHELDVVISDAGVAPGSSVRAFNHALGQCGVSVFGARQYFKLRRDFPRSLDDAPMLLPLSGTPLRRALDGYFSTHEIRPRVIAEFEDSALLKVFGGDGVGVFVAPSAVEREVRRQYGVELLGRITEVQERFYAITVERRIKHPAVVAISENARHEIFRVE